MKLILAPRPPAGHVHAVAAVSLAASVIPALPALPGAGRRHGRSSLAAYLAVTGLNVPQAAVARALGRQRHSICRALREIEMRRDVAEFDAALQAAEQEMCPA